MNDLDNFISLGKQVEVVNNIEQSLLVEIRGLLEKILNQLIYMDMRFKE